MTENQTAGRCPTCNSPSPRLHPAVQFEGEVERCSDAYHATADILAEIEMHRDGQAVRRFANLMTVKMAAARAKGRNGWQQCSIADLWKMLREHVEKGDPIDVANFAMMIHFNSEIIGDGH